ncbi:MAG: hypothetical protein OSA98_09250 [Rubripirellula sp.]|nr:hypothetical protein [Rubripirellula sp.]
MSLTLTRDKDQPNEQVQAQLILFYMAEMALKWAQGDVHYLDLVSGWLSLNVAFEKARGCRYIKET